MIKNILVTGGLGFIGSNFVRYILEETEHNVVILDAITYCGNLENVSGLKEKYKDRFSLVIGNINNRDTVIPLVRKCQYLVNFAAESHVDNSIINPGIFYETNVQGTLNLLDICTKFGIERYLQVSTDEVYGSLNLEDEPFTIGSPIKPSSPYSASKASADMLVQAFYKTYQTPTLVTRCSNNYGPYQYPEKLIPLCISKLSSGENIPVYGTGENVRDWIHVYDHCTAILKVLERGEVGKIYNVGSSNEKTNLDIIRTIVHALNLKDHYLKYVNFVKDRPGHDMRYAIDSTSTRFLGWKPVKRFEESLRETVYWYTSNKQWLDNIIERKKVCQ